MKREREEEGRKKGDNQDLILMEGFVCFVF